MNRLLADLNTHFSEELWYFPQDLYTVVASLKLLTIDVLIPSPALKPHAKL